MYFLRQLKRTYVEKADLFRFQLHQLYIGSVCNYAISVFHVSLPQYLIDDLERLQKRALSIIRPTLSYDNALASLKLDLEVFLVVYHQRLCQSLFDNILQDSDHCLHHLLADSHNSQYTLRHAKNFDVKCFLTII